ncbi:MAG: PilZ domain-containing protein [Marinicaulis sp.]|nr:PilZ domain-containing protein [Marinicaulis sp.]NNE40576.1 PilZ domain-containing protein [Marinicaulis sp.]NNL88190.1 PilZ domain-containing protein [Marinicaulis sp.]
MSNKENRRFQRVSLKLPATVAINAGEEIPAELINISPGDMALMVDVDVIQGDAVVVSIDGLDIIEGTVARNFPDGFAVSFRLSKGRRTKLIERIMVLANPNFADGLKDRRNTPRHRDMRSRTVCRLSDGTSLFVKIMDKSVDGVAVEASRQPPVGSVIHIGRQRGIVMRHSPGGFIVVYDKKAATPKRMLRAV